MGGRTANRRRIAGRSEQGLLPKLRNSGETPEPPSGKHESTTIEPLPALRRNISPGRSRREVFTEMELSLPNRTPSSRSRRRFRIHRVRTPDLEPHPVVSPDFEAKFVAQLTHVKARNENNYLERVAEEHLKLQEAERDRTEQIGLTGEERRKIATVRMGQKSVEKVLSRDRVLVQLWSEVIFAALFALRIDHERRSLKAIATLSVRLLPMLRRRVQVVKRQAIVQLYTEERLRYNPKLTPEQLTSLKGGFFQNWTPDALQNLIKKMRPRSYPPGQVIMHDGDFDRAMFVLTNGKADILLRNKKSKSKARTEENSSAKFRTVAPTYFGEYALLCMEPRSATIVATSPCDTYIISQAIYVETLQLLPHEVRTSLTLTANKRRKENLKNYFPLRVSVLRDLPFLAHLRPDVLQEIADAMEPDVLLPKQPFFNEADADSNPSFFLVGDGAVRIWSRAPGRTEERILESGECFGEFEAFFTHEPRMYSAETFRHTDVWSIPRSKIFDVGVKDASGIMKCMKELQQIRAARMIRPSPVPHFFLHDPFLACCKIPPSVYSKLWGMAVPQVYCAGDVICTGNEEMQYMYAVVSGTINIRFLSNEWAVMTDNVTVIPRVGLTAPLRGNDTAHPIQIYAPHLSEAFFDQHSAAETSSLRKRSLRGNFFQPNQRVNGVGLLFGAFEFASRTTRFQYTVTALACCEVWKIPKKEWEKQLTSQQISFLENKKRIRSVLDAWSSHKIASLFPPVEKHSKHAPKIQKAISKSLMLTESLTLTSESL